MSTIEIRKVTKQFGAFTAVKDADLKVEAGEVVCLLGPSGCGKTTTLRMIAGLERATSGDVIIAGQRMNELSPQKRDIAMVFQFYALYPALTVGQNIAMPLHYENLSKSESDARVMKVAQIMHLTDPELAAWIRQLKDLLKPDAILFLSASYDLSLIHI